MNPPLSTVAGATPEPEWPAAAVPSSARDRLTTALFLVSLLHGILIIGVTFSALTLPVRTAPTLEVLLLAGDRAESEDNPDAQYLAERGQTGAGNTAEAERAASPESSMFPAAVEGVVQGTGVEYREAVAGSPSRELLASRSERSDVNVDSGRDEPSRDSETPLALVPTPPSSVIASAADEALRLRGDASRVLEIRADTRESALAPYLDAWKRKIERIGALNFPRDSRRRRMSGNPVLAVTILADGTLDGIAVQRSSGYREIDQAALNILKLASPFDPFPAALRQRYDRLRFAYEWQFLGDDAAGSLSVVTPES